MFEGFFLCVCIWMCNCSSPTGWKISFLQFIAFAPVSKFSWRYLCKSISGLCIQFHWSLCSVFCQTIFSWLLQIYNKFWYQRAWHINLIVLCPQYFDYFISFAFLCKRFVESASWYLLCWYLFCPIGSHWHLDNNEVFQLRNTLSLSICLSLIAHPPPPRNIL